MLINIGYETCLIIKRDWIIYTKYACPNPYIHAIILIYTRQIPYIHTPDSLYTRQNPYLQAIILIYTPHSLYTCQNPYIHATFLIYAPSSLYTRHIPACEIVYMYVLEQELLFGDCPCHAGVSRMCPDTGCHHFSTGGIMCHVYMSYISIVCVCVVIPCKYMYVFRIKESKTISQKHPKYNSTSIYPGK